MTPQMRQRSVRYRMLAVGIGLFLLLGVVVGQAFRLQILTRDRLLYEAERNYMRTKIIESRRGEIYDRNGEQLATSVRVDTVVVVPVQVEDKAGTAEKLASALEGVKASDLLRKMQAHSWWVYAKRRISDEESKKVRELQANGLPGVEITQEPKRFYPKRTLAGQLLGCVGLDNEGLEGLEKAFDGVLVSRQKQDEGADVEGTTQAGQKKGKAPLDVVKVPYLKDRYGSAAFVQGLPSRLLPEGYSVMLTIDEKIQGMAQDALKRGVEAHHAHSGVALVMDVPTGEILAMANYPEFDPNAPDPRNRYAWKNRAVKDQFEPGSTFKVFSLAAVLDAGMARLEDIVDCENGAYRIGRYFIRDTHRSGKITAKEVLSHSSNIGIAKLTRRIGKKALYDAVERFGFGRPTGVEVDSESTGRVQPLKRWAEITFANVSFGQGVAVTPIQLIRAIAAIGNKGVMMRPQLVKALLDADGNVVRDFLPVEDGRVVSERAARLTLDAMVAVTQEGGTGTNAAIDGYTVAGKTGTAQKPETGYRNGVRVGKSGGYRSDAWIASFVGLVPAEDPKLAVVVIIDEPEGRGFGGTVSAPVFREITSWTLKYLGIAPSQRRPVKVSRVAKGALPQPRAEEQPIDAGVEVTEVGSEPVEEDGMITEAKVPDFLGSSIGHSLDTATSAHVRIAVEGTGKAVSQSVAPQTVVTPWTVVEVKFASAFDQVSSAKVPLIPEVVP